MLADSRFPAGGHAHSGGIEAAITAGTVADLASLEVFLCGRLRTSGMVAAGLAAAACAGAGWVAGAAGEGYGSEAEAGGIGVSAESVTDDQELLWGLLDAHADARTPSPAQREASRRQGRALLRAARIAWPRAAGMAGLAAGGFPGGPHHAVVLGAAAAAGGCLPLEAARIAAYQSVSGPASAAVRLLALDPMRAAGVLARLCGEVDEVAGLAAAAARGPLDDLPYPSAPALDLLAEAHSRAEVRLFES
jgi:urease accessory protein